LTCSSLRLGSWPDGPAAALFPFLIVEYAGGARANWNATAIAVMLYVGVAASLLANLLYMFGIARVGPGRAGMFIHLVPLYGAIMSIAVLGESMHLYHAFGMAAIMAGLACSSMADKHRFEWLRRTRQKTTGAFR